MTKFSENRRRLLRTICQGLGATAAFGVFQSCSGPGDTAPAYGMPSDPPPGAGPAYGVPSDGPTAAYGVIPDRGNDIAIHGTVLSENTEAPIPGIRVSVKDLSSHTYTDDYGDFVIYVPRQDSYKLKFEDAEGSFQTQKKKIALEDADTPLDIYLSGEDDEE